MSQLTSIHCDNERNEKNSCTDGCFDLLTNDLRTTLNWLMISSKKLQQKSLEDDQNIRKFSKTRRI